MVTGYTEHMERAHLFIGGIIIVSVIAIGIVVTTTLSSQHTPPAPQDTSGYATFNTAPNIFESLTRTQETPTTLVTTTTPPVSHESQTQALSHIIRTWEERPGSSDARAARTTIAVERTQQQREQDEISVLFNDLIGPRVTDYTAQQSDYSSLSSNDLIWGGDLTTNTSGSASAPGYTDTQQAVHRYGNELGETLQAFNLAQGDQAALLEAFIETRDATRLKRLADAYVTLGEAIALLSAPAPVISMHNGMTISYTAVGELLFEVSIATDDEDLMERMLTYNAVAEDVARHHVAFITTLKAYGITYKSHEPGNIFMFSPTAGKSL